jgi:hypothetical protein
VVSNLIINGDIINPPTSVTCFRELTLIANKAIHLKVIVESMEKDFCWRYLKNFGAMDYVDDILKVGEEEGIRIDTGYNYSPTIFVSDRIDYYNLKNILNAIGFNKSFV